MHVLCNSGRGNAKWCECCLENQARFFDHKVLDLVELAVTGYTATADIKCEKRKAPGSKPCFLFQGDWEADPRLATLKSLFLGGLSRWDSMCCILFKLRHPMLAACNIRHVPWDGCGANSVASLGPCDCCVLCGHRNLHACLLVAFQAIGNQGDSPSV
jgi:hypothetical protein